MKKLLGIVVLSFLWCNVGIAAENAEELNKNCIRKGTTEFNKKVKQRVKKNFVTVMYFGCKSMASWHWNEETSKDLDTSHQVAYKKCLKGASEYKIETCHLFSINDKIVYGKDAAFVAKVEKEIKERSATKVAKNNAGRCIKGDCHNGQGTMTWANGDKYVGEFKNNLPNGQGTYTFAGGKKIVGEWKDGLTVQDFQKKEKQKAGTVNYVFDYALLDGDPLTGEYLYQDIFQHNSPTTFKKLTFNKERTVETIKGDSPIKNRRNKKKRFKSFQFTAEYEENITVEIFVEHQDSGKNLKRAEYQALKYAKMFGQMPHFLKIYTDKFYVHKDAGKDTGLWWAQPRDREFHIKRSRCKNVYQYSPCGVTMLHELAHIIQKLTGVISPSKWGEARKLDNKKYCSKYAKKNNREDFAESILCWFGVRYKSDKLTKSHVEKIKEYIPNRLKFFDEMNFNMHPL